MTAHTRALPRLYDELNSSHLCVHGASRQALAIGFVVIGGQTLVLVLTLIVTPVAYTLFDDIGEKRLFARGLRLIRLRERSA